MKCAKADCDNEVPENRQKWCSSQCSKDYHNIKFIDKIPVECQRRGCNQYFQPKFGQKYCCKDCSTFAWAENRKKNQSTKISIFREGYKEVPILTAHQIVRLKEMKRKKIAFGEAIETLKIIKEQLPQARGCYGW